MLRNAVTVGLDPTGAALLGLSGDGDVAAVPRGLDPIGGSFAGPEWQWGRCHSTPSACGLLGTCWK